MFPTLKPTTTLTAFLFLYLSNLHVVKAVPAPGALWIPRLERRSEARDCSIEPPDSILKKNGLDAQKLNQDFKSIQQSDSCEEGRTACIQSQLAQCRYGRWALEPCESGRECFALPLDNESGTSIECEAENGAEARFDAACTLGGPYGSFLAPRHNECERDGGSLLDPRHNECEPPANEPTNSSGGGNDEPTGGDNSESTDGDDGEPNDGDDGEPNDGDNGESTDGDNSEPTDGGNGEPAEENSDEPASDEDNNDPNASLDGEDDDCDEDEPANGLANEPAGDPADGPSDGEDGEGDEGDCDEEDPPSPNSEPPSRGDLGLTTFTITRTLTPSPTQSGGNLNFEVGRRHVQ